MSPLQLLPFVNYVASYAIGKILKLDAHRFGLINGISTLAQLIFYDFVTRLPGTKEISRSKIKFISYCIFPACNIVALRHFNVVAEKGTVILSFIGVGLATIVLANAIKDEAWEI